MARILVTGANRGLGLELVRQSLADGDTVIATARRPGEAETLRALATSVGDRLHVLELAVDSPASIGRAADLVSSLVPALDLLVNNAGVGFWEPLETLTAAQLEQAFRTNAIGPLLVTRAFRPLLARGTRPLVVNISSILGSIRHSRQEATGSYDYNASKAALNMITAKLAHDLKGDGITVISQHPGWVRTDMGGEEAPFEAHESVSRQRRVWSGLSLADSGRFLDLDGTDLAE